MTPDDIDRHWAQSVIEQQKQWQSGDGRPGPHDQAFWTKEQAFWLSVIARQLAELNDGQSNTRVRARPDTRKKNAAGQRVRGPNINPIKFSDVRAPDRGIPRVTHYIVEYVKTDPPRFDKVVRKRPKDEDEGITTHRVYAATPAEAVRVLMAHLKKQRNLVYVDDNGEVIDHD